MAFGGGRRVSFLGMVMRRLKGKKKKMSPKQMAKSTGGASARGNVPTLGKYTATAAKKGSPKGAGAQYAPPTMQDIEDMIRRATK